MTDTYDYDAFGNLVDTFAVNGISTPNAYRYHGEQYDSDLSLYYLRARYADPDRGRFWTMDDFEGFGTDPASLHKYTFNHNDPINRKDPSGHSSLAENQTVMGLVNTVRGALEALKGAFASCQGKRSMVMIGIGVGIGAAISGAITGFIDLFSDEVTSETYVWNILEGAAYGGLDAAFLSLNPYAFMAWTGFVTSQDALELWADAFHPNMSPWEYYIRLTALVVGFLPTVSPKLAKQLSEMLAQFCFPGETEVATPEGEKRIDEIEVGDYVWARSDTSGEVGLRRVKQIFVNVAAALVLIHSGTETLRATPEHPMWIVGEGWTSAKYVEVGDTLLTKDGDLIEVTDLSHQKGQFTVYNFEVEEFHSYFVGESGVWAHNTGGDKCEELLKAAARTKAGAADDIYVIGRQVDTAIAKDWAGHKILDIANWTLKKNDAWVQGIIDSRAKVYIGTPQTPKTLWDAANNRPTVFARELEQLLAAGYKQIGDYLHPPGL